MSISINSPYGKMIIPTLRDVDISATGLIPDINSCQLMGFCAFNELHWLTHAFADLYYPFSLRDLHPDSTDSKIILFLAFCGV